MNAAPDVVGYSAVGFAPPERLHDVRALLKRQPEDFQVLELPAARPDPQRPGAHRAYLIQKAGYNSESVAKRLARWARVPRLEVGYAGRKDRHALTEQWFTVPAAAASAQEQRIGAALPEFGAPATPAGWIRCRAHGYLPRKLRAGALSGNRFVIRLRPLAGEAALPFEAIVKALHAANARGFPNAFGAQRFGRSGLVDAFAWAEARTALAATGGHRRGRRRERAGSQDAKGWHLSVLRAFLFNECLKVRLQHAPKCDSVPGDVLVAGAPQGPLWGRGRHRAEGLAAALQDAALASHQKLLQVLEHGGPQLQYRPFRVRAQDVTVHRSGVDLIVAFRLPPGSYATVFLDQALALLDGSLGSGVPEAKALSAGTRAA